jgi:hypothetical protein
MMLKLGRFPETRKYMPERAQRCLLFDITGFVSSLHRQLFPPHRDTDLQNSHDPQELRSRYSHIQHAASTDRIATMALLLAPYNNAMRRGQG